MLIRVFGILGVLCSLVGFQCRKHYQVLGLRTANEVFFSLQYLLLGGYTGAMLNCVGSVRNVIFAVLVGKGKRTYIPRLIFSLIFVIFAAITWSGIPSLVFCIGKVTTTFVYGSKNLTFVRVMTVFTSCMWIIYNLSIGAYEGIISDLVCIVSASVAIVRIDIMERRKLKKESADDGDSIEKA